MIYEIIEDESPYYIKFKFDGLDDMVKFVQNTTPTFSTNVPKKQIENPDYYHQTFNLNLATQIIDMLPLSKQIEFNKAWLAIFKTPPNGGAGIHKDGQSIRTSINIPISILDEECTTSWYSDDMFDERNSIGAPYTRNIEPDVNNLNQYKPVKTMIAKVGEAILFNVDRWHAWHNKSKIHYRSMMIMRAVDVINIYFEDIKKIIYENQKV